MRVPTRRISLFCICLLGPTLFVPIERWHHHCCNEENQKPAETQCSLCLAAKSVAADTSAIVSAAPLCFIVEALPELFDRPERVVPVAHPARGPPQARCT
jgi:hypothetical protein